MLFEGRASHLPIWLLVKHPLKPLMGLTICLSCGSQSSPIGEPSPFGNRLEYQYLGMLSCCAVSKVIGLLMVERCFRETRLPLSALLARCPFPEIPQDTQKLERCTAQFALLLAALAAVCSCGATPPAPLKMTCKAVTNSTGFSNVEPLQPCRPWHNFGLIRQVTVSMKGSLAEPCGLSSSALDRTPSKLWK